MKVRLFESENLDFRRQIQSSRSGQVSASMEDWPNQEVINQEFKALVHKELKDPSNRKKVNGRIVVDLNHLSVEAFRCTDFRSMFNNLASQGPGLGPDPNSIKTNIDVSKWDVSRGKNFEYMFHGCYRFDCDVSNWDMSRAESIDGMFRACIRFNQDLSKWDVSRCKSFHATFCECKSFDQPVKWDTRSGVRFSRMFDGCQIFNSELNIDVSGATQMTAMFRGCKKFNQPIGHWDVSNCKHFDFMFTRCKSFDQDLSNWNIRHTESDGVKLTFMYRALHMFTECPIKNEHKPKPFYNIYI